MAVFSMAIYMGELVGLLSAYVSQHYNWRIAFVALGLPGFVMAVILVLTLREPERGMSEKWKEEEDEETEKEEGSREIKNEERTEERNQEQQRLTIAETTEDGEKDDFNQEEQPTNLVASSLLRRIYFLMHLPAYLIHCIVATIRNMGGYALGAWMQVFLVRTYGLSPSDYTIWLALIIPIGTPLLQTPCVSLREVTSSVSTLGGGLGAALGGIIADRLYKVSTTTNKQTHTHTHHTD